MEQLPVKPEIVRNHSVIVEQSEISDWNLPDYEVVKFLEKGGSGRVFLVRKYIQESQRSCLPRRHREMLYACKRCLCSPAITREYSYHSKLNHINVVKCMDFFQDLQFANIIMEYVNGHDLVQIRNWAGGKDMSEAAFKTSGVHLTPEKVTDYILQIAQGLKYCHSQDIVHRDIKMENIIVSREEEKRKGKGKGKKGNDKYFRNGGRSVVKICDFGCSCDVKEPEAEMNRLYGTPVCISPEQIHRQVHSETFHKVDSWALGVLIYELVCGVNPFGARGDGGGNPLDIVDKILTLPIDISNMKYSPFYSERLGVLTGKLLDRNVSTRFSASDVIDFLHK